MASKHLTKRGTSAFIQRAISITTWVNQTLFLKCTNPSFKILPVVLSGNQTLDINRQKMAWLEAKNEVAWLEAKKDNTNLTHCKQEHYNWCFPSEKDHDKHVIHGTPNILNDNTCSLSMTNIINNNIFSHVDSAAAIASIIFACPSRRKHIPYVRRPTSQNEFRKRVIH